MYRYIEGKYILENPYISTYNVLVPKSNGSGFLGEKLSTPIISVPLSGATDTFISIGMFKTYFESESCLKYVKSKFLRALLSIKKITQDNPKSVWSEIPLQDFTPNSDIDWTKSVSEIDQQLYKKYDLTADEIEFIETKVQVME